MKCVVLLIYRTFSISRRIHSSSDRSDARIRALVQQGCYHQALQWHSKQSNRGTSRFLFPSLLKACTSVSNFSYGGILHSEIIKVGLHLDPYIINSLIRMYVKSGSSTSAQKLFENVSQCEILQRDVALWNSSIDGCVKIGFFEEGVAHFRRMMMLNVKPDGYTLCILVGMCNGLGVILLGKEIHGCAVRNYFDHDPFLITAMIDMYSGFSRPMEAWNVFEKLENKCNIAVWNSMINGFSDNGLWRNSLQLYTTAKREGLDLGSTTYASTLAACSQGEDVDFGCQLHRDVVKAGLDNDSYVCTSLITCYSNCGYVEEAERIVCLSGDTDAGIWNATLSAYINHGCANDALDIYTLMRNIGVVPDSFTISNALIACSMIGLCSVGMMIHGELTKVLIEDSITVQSALQTMYSKVGRAKDAYKVFTEMKEKDVVAWGSIICGNCGNMIFDEALTLFKTMFWDDVRPDPNILASILNASTGLGNVSLGRSIHGFAIKEGLDLNAFTVTALIEFYSKCGQPDMARKSFSNVLQKNLVIWNSLISCYCLNGQPDVSISLLPQILRDGLYPDSVTITIALSAVSQMAALLTGKTIHCFFIRLGISQDIQVDNSLLDMYTKCGGSKYAQTIFSNMSTKDLIAWNSIIAGYGFHGECLKAMDMYQEMRSSGTTPDEITFLSLLSSCNHSGFVDEGLNLFHSMREHGVEPKMEHYINIVDLLGRSGHLVEAYEFINSMVIAPDQGVWLCLLSACRVYKNVELGELAAHHLIEIDPSRASNYIQLLNLYVETGLNEKAANLRALMRQKGLTKLPGCSWIEVKNKVDVFFSRDSSSPMTIEIYEALESLMNHMRIKECDREASENVWSKMTGAISINYKLSYY